jgi:hypothetical protein
MTIYRGRRAATIENDALRVTVLEGGGHIAEILDKPSGVSPLWIPHWPSIEPDEYDPARHPEYGEGADASLLAGIMGHSLCLDIFGGPSADEAAAGLPAHGEATTARFAIDVNRDRMAMHATLPSAQLRVSRRLTLADRTLHILESVENLTRTDRPVGWTQHVTLAPPFLEDDATELRVTADRSMVYEGTFGPADYLVPGATFAWPLAPRQDGGVRDLRHHSKQDRSSAYTTHRMDPRAQLASFAAFSPSAALLFGYLWRRTDFPWLGIWEENCSRSAAPWHRRERALGMEFGVSPVPESRRAMIARASLFDTATFRWIPARSRVDVEYRAVLRPARGIEESLE